VVHHYVNSYYIDRLTLDCWFSVTLLPLGCVSIPGRSINSFIATPEFANVVTSAVAACNTAAEARASKCEPSTKLKYIMHLLLNKLLSYRNKPFWYWCGFWDVNIFTDSGPCLYFSSSSRLSSVESEGSLLVSVFPSTNTSADFIVVSMVAASVSEVVGWWRSSGVEVDLT